MFNKFVKQASRFVDKNSANILTGLGMAGVVTTAVLAVKATPKAQEMIFEREEYKMEVYDEPLTKFEKVISAAPAYFPAILMGATTMSCIYGANYINKRNQAIITGAYSYLSRCYDEYREKVIELQGEEMDEKIRDSIAIDKYIAENPVSVEEEQELYYDEYSQKFFHMNPNKLKQILYDINKIYLFNGEMCLNDIYDFLGLEATPYGWTVGWAVNKDFEYYGAPWIDIRFEKMEMSDDLECKVLTFNHAPSPDYEQYYW